MLVKTSGLLDETSKRLEKPLLPADILGYLGSQIAQSYESTDSGIVSTHIGLVDNVG